MDYKDTTDFLYSLYRHGIKLGLESISTVLQSLGNPHQTFPSLHIGGTNGKGSTAAALAHILQATGSRVGLYTSPHLVDFRERIRINGQYIPAIRVVEITQRLRALDLAPQTFFEFTTAMAFAYFAEECVDIAVIEVGMGGRFDATNVVIPYGVVITTIAHDHQQYLGTTLPDIAFEKAGIIKEGIPVIVGDVPPEASVVIRQVAKDKQAPYYGLGSEFHVVPDSMNRFQYDGLSETYADLSCALQGEHQMKNAACALALLETVQDLTGAIPESLIRASLATVQWEGRVEILGEHPTLIIDGAHNPASATALVETLIRMLRCKPDAQLVLVLGMMQDKDRKNFLERFRSLVRFLILTPVSVPRASSVSELKQDVPDGMCVTYEASSPAEALLLAKRLAMPNDIICVTGSLFLAGEVRILVKGEYPTCS